MASLKLPVVAVPVRMTVLTLSLSNPGAVHSHRIRPGIQRSDTVKAARVRVNVFDEFVSLPRTMIVAFGTTAPVLSVIVPWIDPPLTEIACPYPIGCGSD